VLDAFNDYCQAPFCFVDAEKCLTSNFSIQMGPQAPFDKIAYPISYETCGSFNTWIKSFKSLQLGAATAARPLRVAAPIASYPEVYRMAAPNSTERQPDGAYPYDGFGPYRGTHVELLEFIASKYDFSFQWVSLSQGSIADHGTTPSQIMDACVQDVTFGILDLCLGFIPQTSFRLEMAPFTRPFDTYHAHFTVPRPPVLTGLADLRERLEKMSSPSPTHCGPPSCS